MLEVVFWGLLLRRTFLLLGDGVSRSGESPSPKRDFEGGFVVLLNLSPKQGTLVLAE